MTDVRRLCELSMVPDLAKEVASQINGATSTKTAVVALTTNTVTPTTGSLPTPNGATTIANTATPTVVELLDLCMELKAKVDAIVAAMKA